MPRAPASPLRSCRASAANGNGGNGSNLGGRRVTGGGGNGGSGGSGRGGLLGQALLGAAALTVTATESASAAPGGLAAFMSRETPLSTSAPSGGRGYGGLLEACESNGIGASRASIDGASPGRPRSKVVHVSVKGSTLVLPMCSNGEPQAACVSRWSRRKVVEAPIELSQREVTMLASRQNRVRDSVLIQ
ncbi:hypothetical protein HYH03_012683 [Edaphochlamys debaryana]|uniref:Uncharacterized protein n=1 Tax=Edaphochlamys debaryana TaxID=47281 RepID=A0A836BU31_9CHLO|nr:hypothetical protein HYH03_012683 [Edaphochlamys debaryana]|eukprot:KAG2488682.1 hypothetical protein HYH03_012683 [Edaphochlamys debaryana]